MIWLPATLLAALFQAWRTAVQARVKKEMSVNAAGLVRYLYGLPVGLLLLWSYANWRAESVPVLDVSFLPWAVLAGFVQIIGTNLLLMAFGHRNFVVGSAYAKTEAVQGAILAAILLGEMLSPLSLVGVGVGVVGVIILSMDGKRLAVSDLRQPAALCGLGAGLCFALTAIFVKRSTFAVGTPDNVLRALVVLVAVQAAQLIMQGSYVALRERDQLVAVFRSWRISSQVGLLAALGSACWFTGFATAPVALVRSVGQIEVLFTMLFGRFYLKEPLRTSEGIGLGIVALGVILALAGA